MSVEQIVCKVCGGRGGYTLGPYPATKCNHCNGKGYTVIESRPAPTADQLVDTIAKLIFTVLNPGASWLLYPTASQSRVQERYRKAARAAIEATREHS